MRGEHIEYGYVANFHSGSSPHARGALSTSLNDMDFVGIIPACAGSTGWFRQVVY